MESGKASESPVRIEFQASARSLKNRPTGVLRAEQAKLIPSVAESYRFLKFSQENTRKGLKLEKHSPQNTRGA